jgi:hypothetical protein
VLQLNPEIDHTMNEFFKRLDTHPAQDRSAIMAAIKCGVRHRAVAEITDALLSVDPVLAALWGQWRETLGIQAWGAVLKTVFLRHEVMEARTNG